MIFLTKNIIQSDLLININKLRLFRLVPEEPIKTKYLCFVTGAFLLQKRGEVKWEILS